MPSRTRPNGADATQEDVDMQDASVVDSAGEDDDQGPYEEFAGQRVKTLPGSTEDAASYEFQGEDHTLGNALRWMIMKNPEVEFCGYSIPHPSEPKMNIRIQTYKPYTPRQALAKGLDDLIDLCDVVTETFTDARESMIEGQRRASLTQVE